MPTIMSHAVAAIALGTAFPRETVPRRLMIYGAACAMAPDLDVLGFHFGIQYGSMFGHRGFTHSITFAVILATIMTVAVGSELKVPFHRGWTWFYLFLATASHGLLDALTNGGHGVAFFSPFDSTRYFFPVTPILASPIGAGFFSGRGLATMLSELRWVWLPSACFVAAAWSFRKFVLLPKRSES